MPGTTRQGSAPGRDGKPGQFFSSRDRDPGFIPPIADPCYSVRAGQAISEAKLIVEFLEAWHISRDHKICIPTKAARGNRKDLRVILIEKIVLPFSKKESGLKICYYANPDLKIVVNFPD